MKPLSPTRKLCVSRRAPYLSAYPPNKFASKPLQRPHSPYFLAPITSAPSTIKGRAPQRSLQRRLIKRGGANSDDEKAWHCAVEVFDRRIHERFLSCIEALESADSKSDVYVPDDAPADCSTLPEKNDTVVPGFAIMALCCLLAETLQSFRCKQELTQKTDERCSYRRLGHCGERREPDP